MSTECECVDVVRWCAIVNHSCHFAVGAHVEADATAPMGEWDQEVIGRELNTVPRRRWTAFDVEHHVSPGHRPDPIWCASQVQLGVVVGLLDGCPCWRQRTRPRLVAPQVAIPVSADIPCRSDIRVVTRQMHCRATISRLWGVPRRSRPEQPRPSNSLRDRRDHAAVERVAMCVWIEVKCNGHRVSSPQKKQGDRPCWECGRPPPWVASRTGCRRVPLPLLVPPWPVALSDAWALFPPSPCSPRSHCLHS